MTTFLQIIMHSESTTVFLELLLCVFDRVFVNVQLPDAHLEDMSSSKCVQELCFCQSEDGVVRISPSYSISVTQ